MGSFIEGNIFNKILAAIPNALNAVLIQGVKEKYRDDFNGSALSSDWSIVQPGSGQTITVGGSELRINTGITANAETIIRSNKTFKIPCKVVFILQISQRIANQEFWLEIVDSSGQNYCKFQFQGTVTNAVNIITANGNVSQTNSVLGSATTASYLSLEADLTTEEIKSYMRATDAGNIRSPVNIREKKLPNPNLDYFIQIRVLNGSTAPASASILFLDAITFRALETIPAEIVGVRSSNTISDSIGVNQASGATFSVGGTVNTNFSTDTVTYTSETIVNLSANANYVATGRDANGKKTLNVTIETSVTGTLYVDQSTDNVVWLQFAGISKAVGVDTFTVNLGLRYYRIRYTNGSTATSTFKILTALRTL